MALRECEFRVVTGLPMHCSQAGARDGALRAGSVTGIQEIASTVEGPASLPLDRDGERRLRDRKGSQHPTGLGRRGSARRLTTSL